MHGQTPSKAFDPGDRQGQEQAAQEIRFFANWQARTSDRRPRVLLDDGNKRRGETQEYKTWARLPKRADSATARRGTGSRRIAGTIRRRAQNAACRLFDEDGKRIRGKENGAAADLALARMKASGRWRPAAEPAKEGEWTVAEVCSEVHPVLRAGSEETARSARATVTTRCGISTSFASTAVRCPSRNSRRAMSRLGSKATRRGHWRLAGT